MYHLLKTFLFLLPPEKAHKIALQLFGIGLSIPLLSHFLRRIYKVKGEPVKFCGLRFNNPVGLAAGFDKNGEYIESMAALGFGFIEVGTVTPIAQIGNPQPRLFRLKKDKALINRMGFNNKGVDYLVEQLKDLPKLDVVIGGNIGKNKVTPNDKAIDDYIICFRKLHPYVDYFVVNVSSPNTPNLRDLQEKEPLKALLQSVKSENETFETQKPILLKIAPDLTQGQIDDVIDIVKEVGIDGIIAANTTISRADLKTDHLTIEEIGNGGLSGRPVAVRATEVISYIQDKSGGTIPIIGVGGIYNAVTAKEKLKAGSGLVQLYTGFIYEGPGVVKRILKGL